MPQGGRAGARPPTHALTQVSPGFLVLGPCPGIRSGPRSSTRRPPPTRAAASCSRSSRGRSPSRRERAGGDPEANFTLAAAIQKARDYSMPKDNIQRAIDRGAGGAGGDDDDRASRLRGLRPGWRRDPRRGADRQPQPHQRRDPPRLRQARRQPRRARLGRLGVREAGRGDGGREPLLRGRPDRGDRRRRRGREQRRRLAQGRLRAPEDLAAVREALESAGRGDRVRRAHDGAEERGRGRRRATPRASCG